MDLLQQISSECGVDEEQAGKALGTLFTAVRMAINVNEHAQLKQAFPSIDDWLGQGTVGIGRTGEMLALIGPEALENNLKSTGVADDNIPKVCSLVGQALVQNVPEIASKVAARLPLIAP